MRSFARALRTSAARAIAAILCAGFVVTGARTAEAGVNAWSSQGLGDAQVYALAVDPSTPSTLYAGTAVYDRGSWMGTVYKSTDAGRTWSAANSGLAGAPIWALAIDPATPTILYAGTNSGVFKSTDGGGTWSAANSGLAEAPVRVFAIDPTTPTSLYAGTDSGVFRSTDGGSSWNRINSGLPGDSVVSALAIDQIAPSSLYAGIAYGDDPGAYRSMDGGGMWEIVLQGGVSVLALAIDPTAPATVYAATAFVGVLKSTDGGATWGGGDYLQFMETVLYALAIDPSRPGTLYAAGGGVFRSTDGGATWRAFDAGLPRGEVRTLAIDGSRPSRLYVGTADGVFSIEQATCTGDCDDNGKVKVGELVTGVNIASDILPLDACPAFDTGADGRVTIDEVMAGVHDGLHGCPTDLTDLSGTLFVTDQNGNKVYTLDAASGRVLDSAGTGVHPVGVEKANGKVYVANETDGTISVYDSATLSPRTVITACEEPHHTAVSPDGSRFYAACLATNKVAVVDTSTDTLVGLLTSGAPGARTHQPWPTKDGKRLWVANWETDDITEIDLETGEILGDLAIGGRPIEVVVSPDGNTAYVSVPSLSTIRVFDLETNELVAEPTMLAPENIILSGDGKRILASRAGIHNPTAALIFDTETLTTVAVDLPGLADSHTDFTPRAKFGFVSLVALPQSGVAVVDIVKAKLHDFYPIPDIEFIHAVRYAPGPP
jgi:YVTN family beta-propeller protein